MAVMHIVRAPRDMPVQKLPLLSVSLAQVVRMTGISDDVIRQVPWRVLPYLRNGSARLYLFRHVELFTERLFALRIARGEPRSVDSLIRLAQDLEPMSDNIFPSPEASPDGSHE